MEILGFIFGIFGFLAYCQISGLNSRVHTLESQLARINGTSSFEARLGLSKAAGALVGQRVCVSLKEHYVDMDIYNYNFLQGKQLPIKILDVDEEWVLLEISTTKGTIEKLIRLEAIKSLSGADGADSATIPDHV